MNLDAQAITQNKRDAQSRIVTMVLGDNRLRKAQPSEGLFPCRTITDLQISGRDLEVAQSIWRPRRDLNPCYRRERPPEP